MAQSSLSTSMVILEQSPCIVCSLLRQLHSWQLCFWFSGSCCPPHCKCLSDDCYLFSWGDWIAPIRSKPFGQNYCHSIKSFASPSSISYLRLFTNLHFLLNPVLAFCLDASRTNVMLFSLILLSWIAAQKTTLFSFMSLLRPSCVDTK